MKKKIIDRLKSITIEGYFVLAISLVCFIMALIFIIYLGIAIATGNSMFSSNESKSPYRFDIMMLITFCIALLLSGTIFGYNLIFRTFKKVPPITKNIVKGHVIERNVGDDRELGELIKEHILQEEGENDDSSIDMSKLKKNLKKNKDDKE